MKRIDGKRMNVRRLLKDFRWSLTLLGDDKTDLDKKDILKVNYLLDRLTEYEQSKSI